MTDYEWINHFNPFGPSHTVTNRQVLLNGKHAPAECANYHCTNRSGFLDSPFCDDCMWKLWAHMEGTQPEEKKELARRGWFEEIHRLEAEAHAGMDAAKEERRRRAKEEFMTWPGTIYYLRVGNLIKIGYTVDISQRKRQYPPNSELLATHPGTRETERQMHHRFLHRIAQGREWFTPCEELDQHIAKVREKYDTEAA